MPLTSVHTQYWTQGSHTSNKSNPLHPSSTLPKIHKERIPIRPLVNFTTVLAYKLAKYRNHILASIRLKNHTAIKISIKLIHNINKKHIPYNSTLALFNITNVYTNIQTSESVQILVNVLKQNNTPQSHIDEIINFTSIIIRTTSSITNTTHNLKVSQWANQSRAPLLKYFSTKSNRTTTQPRKQ